MTSGNEQNPKKLHEFVKNRYFYGKLMTVRDFDLEQGYFNEKRWLINRLMFGTGVAFGLNVTKHPDPESDEPAKQFRVSAGVALDQSGREIVVPYPQNYSSEDLFRDKDTNDHKKDGDYFLVLKYSECNKDPVRAHDPSACREVCQYGRIAEGYSLSVEEAGDSWRNAGEFDCSLVSRTRSFEGEVTDGTTRYGTFTRTSRKLKLKGPMEGFHYEITLRFDAKSDKTDKDITITDIPDAQAVLVHGTYTLEIPQGVPSGTITYGIRVTSGFSINAEAKINGSVIALEQQQFNPRDAKESVTAGAVTEFRAAAPLLIGGAARPGRDRGLADAAVGKNLKDAVISWRQRDDAADGIDEGVVLARIKVIAGDVADIRNYSKMIVFDAPSVAGILSCLRERISTLEYQALRMKVQIAPNIVEVTGPSAIKAGDTGTIRITVKGNEGLCLPDVLVNVHTTLGSLEKRQVKTESSGSAENLLTAPKLPGMMTVIAHTNSGIGILSIPCTSAEPKTGGISLATIPPGAVISVDRIPSGKITPNIVDNIPGGNHTVELRMEYYKPVSLPVTVDNGRITEVPPVTMEMQTGFLKVQCNKAGADIYVDSVRQPERTTAAGTSLSLPVRSHTVMVGMEGYSADPQYAEILDGRTTTLSFTLSPLATGTIYVHPRNSYGGRIRGLHERLQIWLLLRDRDTGIWREVTSGPAEFHDDFIRYENCLQGVYRITLRADGFESITRPFSLDKAEVSVEVNLESASETKLAKEHAREKKNG